MFKLRYYENKLGCSGHAEADIGYLRLLYCFKVILKQNIPAYASYLLSIDNMEFFCRVDHGTIQILNVKNICMNTAI